MNLPRMKKHFLTAEGLASLKEKVSALYQDRTDISAELKQMRQQEGVRTESDRVELSELLRRSQLIEEEIRQTEHVIANTKIIKKPRKFHKVELGSCVYLVGKGVKFCYRIVNPLEANPGEGKISDQSPLGKALLGKSLREKIEWRFGTKGPMQLTLERID